jgi:putative effector of murein hydrolase
MSDTPPHHSTRQLKARFHQHLRTNVLVAVVILSISLGIGMLGYREFAGLAWIDAFLNASMLLSGMGPMSPMLNDSSKLFAGTYALYCGVVFVATVGLVLAPVVAHVMRRLHLNEKG